MLKKNKTLLFFLVYCFKTDSMNFSDTEKENLAKRIDQTCIDKLQKIQKGTSIVYIYNPWNSNVPTFNPLENYSTQIIKDKSGKDQVYILQNKTLFSIVRNTFVSNASNDGMQFWNVAPITNHHSVNEQIVITNKEISTRLEKSINPEESVTQKRCFLWSWNPKTFLINIWKKFKLW